MHSINKSCCCSSEYLSNSDPLRVIRYTLEKSFFFETSERTLVGFKENRGAPSDLLRHIHHIIFVSFSFCGRDLYFTLNIKPSPFSPEVLL